MLIAKAKIRLDRHYLTSKYDDWLRHISRWRRHDLHRAFALLSAGALLVLLSGRQFYYSWIVLLIGVIDVIESGTHRARWLRKAGLVHMDGTEVMIEFSDDTVVIQQPGARAELSWSILAQDFKSTPNSLFLCRNGSSIYIPNECISPPDAKSELVRRLEQSQVHGISRRPTLTPMVAGESHPVR